MDRRSNYLEIALELFLEHGFNGVSMDQLVERAGGSKATLYRYFDSKEQLFEAIIDDLSDRTAPPAAGGDLGDLELEDGLRALGRATAAAALNEPVVGILRLALGEYARFPNLARTLFEHGPAAGYARFRQFTEAKDAAGEISVGDHQIAAEQFLAGIVGHQQLRMALGVGTPTPDDIERRIDAAIASFLAAYRPALRSMRLPP